MIKKFYYMLKECRSNRNVDLLGFKEIELSDKKNELGEPRNYFSYDIKDYPNIYIDDEYIMLRNQKLIDTEKRNTKKEYCGYILERVSFDEKKLAEEYMILYLYNKLKKSSYVYNGIENRNSKLEFSVICRCIEVITGV